MKQAIRSFITEYLGELLEGNAALFAGAGLSAAAGYVDWRELIRPLSVELELDIELESDLVAVAQFHVNAHGYNRHRLHQAVIEALSPDNPPTENHKLLARLPIRTWWTTNYDKLIETALRDAGKWSTSKAPYPNWPLLALAAMQRSTRCTAMLTGRIRQSRREMIMSGIRQTVALSSPLWLATSYLRRFCSRIQLHRSQFG